MLFEFQIATSYLFPRKWAQGKVLMLQNVSSLIGVAIGIAVLIIAMSMFDGYRGSLEKTFLSIHPHLQIFPLKENWKNQVPQKLLKKIKKQNIILQASPLFEKKIFGGIQREEDIHERQAEGTFFIRGLEFDQEGNSVINLKDNLTDGREKYTQIQASRIRKEKEIFNVVVDQNLARYFSLLAGDILFLSFQEKLIHLRVRGIFSLGVQASGEQSFFIYTGSNNFRKIFPGTTITKLGLRLEDAREAEAFSQKLKKELGEEFQVIPWQTLVGNLFSLIDAVRFVSFVVLFGIVLLSCYFLGITIYIFTIQKQKDIAILRSMGASPLSIQWIFLQLSLITTIIGILLGLVVGWLLSNFFTNELNEILQKVTGISQIDPAFEISTILSIVLLTLLLSLLSAWLPARHASRIEPKIFLD